MNANSSFTAAFPLDLSELLSSHTPSSVLITEVRAPRLDSSSPHWVDGPLPIRQGANQTTRRRENHGSTDAVARRTLVASHQADTLYGGAGLLRSHRLTGLSTGDAVLAAELLMGPHDEARVVRESVGLLALHVALPDPTDSSVDVAFERHLELLAGAVGPGLDPKHDLWASASALLPDDVKLVPKARIRTVTFHTLPSDGEEDQRHEALAAAYQLVTSTAPTVRRDMSARALRHQLTLERRDWSALVMRDGAAFVSHQNSDEPFAHVLRVLVHSIYVDAMLLALVQRRLVDRSGDDAVKASLEDPEQLVRLERQHFDFKRRYWRTSLTEKRTSPADDVLRSLQSELLTTQDVSEVEARVHDGARLARTLHAERQDRAQRELARVVQNASVVLGALGLSFTAAPVIADPSWQLFGLAAAAGIVGMFAAFALLFLTGRRVGRG